MVATDRFAYDWQMQRTELGLIVYLSAPDILKADGNFFLLLNILRTSIVNTVHHCMQASNRVWANSRYYSSN